MTEKNIKLLEKYPYLRRCNCWTGEPMDDDFDYTSFDDVPNGWRQLFLQMCDEINKLDYIPDNFYFSQIKEKFGDLRMYACNHTTEIENLIGIYNCISSHVCMYCGKPDCKVTAGWITTICDECYEKYFIKKGYGNSLDDLVYEPLKKTLTYETYKNGKWEEYKIDISYYVDKYINWWEENNNKRGELNE